MFITCIENKTPNLEMSSQDMYKRMCYTEIGTTTLMFIKIGTTNTHVFMVRFRINTKYHNILYNQTNCIY